VNFHVRCFLLLVLTATLWSTGGAIIKSVDWPPLGIAAARSVFALLVLVSLGRGPSVFKRPTGMRFLTGLLLALVSVTFILATKLTTAANAIFLQYTAPIWVALLAPVLLKEPTRKGDWVFIGAVFCGMALFFLDDISLDDLAGIGLAVVSGIIYAGLAMTLRHEDEEGRMAGLVYGNMLLVLLGIAVFRPPWPTGREILLLAALGGVQFGLAYYFYALASRGVTALEMTLVTALEPILNPLWVFFWTGERPAPWALAGGGIVLAAVTLWGIGKARTGGGGHPPSGGGAKAKAAASVKVKML
jgi:drug/metabolite transporter (DMT)-like permease